MEYIEIKNFGPVKALKIEIRDINILIGKTSSGKSTVAKLICIFNSNEFIGSGALGVFKKLLKDYNIDFEIKDNTYIKYSKNNYHWVLNKKRFNDNYSFKRLIPLFKHYPYFVNSLNDYDKERDYISLGFLVVNTVQIFNESKFENIVANDKKAAEIAEQFTKVEKLIGNDFWDNSEIDKAFDTLQIFYRNISNVIDFFNPLYIPAERILLSMVAESVFGLLESNVSIAECIKDFGSRFETARKELKEVAVDMLAARYSYSNKTNIITLKDGNNIELEKASSGFQSLIPLFLIIEHFLKKKSLIKHCVTVEEPELNLYPTVQKKLVEFLIQKTIASESKLIITTHSPYVLTAVDNLIQAHNVATQKPETKAEVAQLIPQEQWLAYDKVTSYYFEDDGTCVSTLDEETQSIGPSNIDDVSIEIGEIYEKLLALKYL